ncbi:hemolysin III family protein [Caldicellulosiruptoraceae bacterium PP1]
MTKSKVSGFIHLAGIILSIFALVFMVYYASIKASVYHVVGFSIFGASLILLYMASTIYHLLPEGTKIRDRMRKVDHMMIFVLIAGTYTPICLVPLHGIWGLSLLIAIWAIALGGVFLKMFFFNAPRWLSTALYILMGWLVVIAFYPLLQNLPLGGVTWLIIGGIFYTIGGIIYGLKKPDFGLKFFGFHEFFHVFVVLGSISHFILMFFYVMNVSIKF